MSMSAPVMAFHYQAPAGQRLEMKLSLDSAIRHRCSFFEDAGMLLEGQAPVYVAPPYYSCSDPVVYEDGKGIRFALAVYVQVRDGNLVRKEDALYVDARGDVWIYVSGITDFQQENVFSSMRN